MSKVVSRVTPGMELNGKALSGNLGICSCRSLPHAETAGFRRVVPVVQSLFSVLHGEVHLMGTGWPWPCMMAVS
ncbi:hypothetical protein BaRGS_00002580 [Batillaria attramentaria]|uniref:Uncharacterized protein n=1 Tax=Batillaria attramentaria TaxID=370345 RepID=A0ABD0M458_9CAEN